jgi:hypothetical protein
LHELKGEEGGGGEPMRREKNLSKQPWLELGCCKNLLASAPFIVVIEVLSSFPGSSEILRPSVSVDARINRSKKKDSSLEEVLYGNWVLVGRTGLGSANYARIIYSFLTLDK